MDKMEINGEVWVKESDISQSAQIAEKTDGMEYCVIRTYSAGVHIGYVKERDGKEIELINSRRIFNWRGACSLSQVAMDGVDVDNSKIAMVVPKIILTECIEIIPTTEKAKKIIEGAEEWKK